MAGRTTDAGGVSGVAFLARARRAAIDAARSDARPPATARSTGWLSARWATRGLRETRHVRDGSLPRLGGWARGRGANGQGALPRSPRAPGVSVNTA